MLFVDKALEASALCKFSKILCQIYWQVLLIINLEFGKIVNQDKQKSLTGEIIMAYVQLRGSDYKVSIHDNQPSTEPDISDGHNGIRAWRLDDSPDLRLIAHSWLNLEHVITEEQKFSDNREDLGFFEPRQYAVDLQKTDKGVRLVHDPLPRTGCACWIEYTPGDRPGSPDFQLGFTPTRRIGAGQVMGLFMPCYIYQPDSKSIHFIGRRNKDSGKHWHPYAGWRRGT